MADVTARWAGAADAASGSTYKIEYTLDNTNWTVAAATQAATAPYAPVAGELAGNTTYGATSILLTDGASFGTSGYAYIDDALVQWTGKSTNTLTGVVWHSGSGTYLTGSTVMVAHESYAATGLTVALGAVLWRITHTNAAGLVSAPAYLWYFMPAAPATSKHCVVITNIATDLGFEPRSGVGVQAYLATDRSFGTPGGAHLDAGQSASKTQTTNAFGLTFHQCVRSAAREDLDGGDAAYTFVLDSGQTGSLTVSAAIPDQDWVLLSQIAD